MSVVPSAQAHTKRHLKGVFHHLILQYSADFSEGKRLTGRFNRDIHFSKNAVIYDIPTSRSHVFRQILALFDVTVT